MTAHDLSLPLPLAVNEVHIGGPATPKVGYAEAASRQVMQIVTGCAPVNAQGI